MFIKFVHFKNVFQNQIGSKKKKKKTDLDIPNSK